MNLKRKLCDEGLNLRGRYSLSALLPPKLFGHVLPEAFSVLHVELQETLSNPVGQRYLGGLRELIDDRRRLAMGEKVKLRHFGDPRLQWYQW